MCGCVHVQNVLLRHTSLGFGAALMQVEDNFLYQVLDVTSLWPSDKNSPVVGEAFWCFFLPSLDFVAQLQIHLNFTLKGAETRHSKRLYFTGQRMNNGKHYH